VVPILPDGGRGYMSTIYDATWLEQRFGPAALEWTEAR